MRNRLLPSLLLATATACSAALLAPTAHAQSLQACGTSNVRLPIGYPASGTQAATQLYAEKKNLRQYLKTRTLQEFTLPTPLPDFVNPVSLLTNGASNQVTGGPCAPNTPMPANVSAQDQKELERIWAIWTQYQESQDLPVLAMLNLNASDFLATSMEDTASCTARTPYMEWDPMVTWVANWPYRGNPYYTDATTRRALLTRGAAWLALQLIMLDWNHFGGTLPLAQQPGATQFVHPAAGLVPPAPGVGGMNYGYELAGQIGHLAFTYLQVKSILPLAIQHAIEKHFIMYAERINTWTPYGVQANLGIRATYGLYLAYQATNDASVYNAYQRAIDGFYGAQSGGRFFPAGYFYDDGRYDSGYNENNLLHTVRVLSLDPNAAPAVWSAAHNMFDLHAHLEFLDPDGSWYSPNEFNTRSSKGAAGGFVSSSPRAQAGGGIQRYLPAAELGLPFAYAAMRDARIVGPQYNSSGIPGGHLDPTASNFYQELACLHGDVFFWMNLAMHNPPAWMPLSTPWPAVPVDRDYATPLFTAANWQHGDIQSWHAAVTSQPALEDFPFELEGPYVRSFDGEFVYAKFKGPQAGGRAYATMIHAGPVGAGDLDVGQNGQHEIIPAGLGGGQVSMFWGPHTGAAVRGMRLGYNNPPNTDQWVQWRSWPNHAATLFTAAGNWTSSARVVAPSTDVTYYTQNVSGAQLRAEVAAGPCPGSTPPASAVTTPNESSAVSVLVRACGDLPDQVRRYSPIPDQVLAAPMPFTRAMYADEDGVTVVTTLTPASSDVISEAWETIPIYDQNWTGVTNYPAATLLFKLTDGTLVNASGAGGFAPQALVAEVYVARANGAFRVVFDVPETVSVSPAWVAGSASSQNLLVDLGRGALPNALPTTSIGYRIEMLTDMNGVTPPP